jgi:signal transduction histidine kinase
MKSLHWRAGIITCAAAVLTLVSVVLVDSLALLQAARADRQLEAAMFNLSDAMSNAPQSRWPALIDTARRDTGNRIYLTWPLELLEGGGTLHSESWDGDNEFSQQPELSDLDTSSIPEPLIPYLEPDDFFLDSQSEEPTLFEYAVGDGQWSLVAQRQPASRWHWIALVSVVALALLWWLAQRVMRPLHIRYEQVNAALNPLFADETAVTDPAQQAAKEITERRRQAQLDEEEWRDLLHGVAHELRSPVARISFALQDWKHCDSAAERSELEADIDRASTELDALVQEVLRYSRLQLQEDRANWRNFDLAELIAACSERLKPVYPGIEITLRGDAPFSVTGDENQLERAIINIMRNGARYGRTQLTVSWHTSTEGWQLEVEDDGPGIPPGKRQRVFEPFTRLDPSRSRDSGGSGLGLAIASAVIGNHQGNISVDDSPLGGARFILSLPR